MPIPGPPRRRGRSQNAIRFSDRVAVPIRSRQAANLFPTKRAPSRELGGSADHASAHHRDHRAGRLVPRRASARRRGTRCGAWSGGRPTRTPPGCASTSGRAARPTATSSTRAALISAVEKVQPGRGLQPRRHLVRADVVAAGRAHRRGHRHGRAAHAGGDPRRERASRLAHPGAGRSASTRRRRRRCSARCARRRRTSARPSTRAARTASRRRTGTTSRRTTASRTACSRCRGILFNHESPRRGAEFVTRKISLGVARIKLGLHDELHAGQPGGAARLGVRRRLRERDAPDARSRTPEDYVIGTGRTHSVRELVELAFATAGLDWRDHVVTDPTLHPARRGRPAVRRPQEGPRPAGLGARRSPSRSSYDDGGVRLRCCRARTGPRTSR